MAVCKIVATFDCAVERVWAVVTSLQNTAWRSDLSRVEVLSDTEFVEYTKDGYPTHFTVTARETCKRWAFDMDNSNMHGHWCGLFREKDGGTEVEFTEEVTAKKFFMRGVVRPYLKSQQALYIADLHKALQ